MSKRTVHIVSTHIDKTLQDKGLQRHTVGHASESMRDDDDVSATHSAKTIDAMSERERWNKAAQRDDATTVRNQNEPRRAPRRGTTSAGRTRNGATAPATEKLPQAAPPAPAPAATESVSPAASKHGVDGSENKNANSNTERVVAGVTTPQPGSKGAKLIGVWTTLIETYRDRPIAFVEDLLLTNYPEFKLEKWQKRFLKAIARGERRISIRAGHGVGKSAACAFALIWHMFCRFPQKSVLTAPTQQQLYDALFAEVKRWISELPKFMRDQVEVTSDRVFLKAAPMSSFMSARTSSAERPEALSGVHSDHVLLVVDEASGVPEPVFESASGSMSSFNATTILISNPTRNTGLFFRTHHELMTSWFRMHVSCVGSSLVSPDFIKQTMETYGEKSKAYYVRVLGEFALSEDDVLIPAELVDAAMGRDVVLDAAEPLVYGLDVARFGDDRTVLLKRQGNVVIEYRVWHGYDLMQTCGWVMHEAQQDGWVAATGATGLPSRSSVGAKAGGPAEIMVDSIGLGAGVADRLRELGLNVRDVNVSEVSAFSPTASKLRDELWLSVKDWLGKRMCKLPKSEELRADLVGPTYAFLSNGKLKVEAKADMKRRGLKSPDLADALCLTFSGAAALVGGRASFWVKGKPLLRNIRGVV